MWTEADETVLIQYVTTNRSQGGDGMNFDHTFWVAAAAEMEKHPCSGASKTAAACQSKWGRLRGTFNVVDKVANASGLSYSMEHGASITPESENMWTDFVKKNPKAKGLRDKGWKHYEALKGLIPVKSGNNNSYFATIVTPPPIIPSPSSGSAVTSLSFDEVHMMDLGDALDGIEFPSSISGGQRATPLTPESLPPFDAAQQPSLESVRVSAPSSTASGKRKLIDDDESTLDIVTRPPHSTKSGDSGKSARLTMPVAIQQMGTSIGGLNTTFERAANALEANTSNTLARSVDPIPLRRQKAVKKLQSEGLEDAQLLNILNKFQADIAIIDIYLAIEVDSLRRLFLEQHSK